MPIRERKIKWLQGCWLSGIPLEESIGESRALNLPDWLCCCVSPGIGNADVGGPGLGEFLGPLPSSNYLLPISWNLPEVSLIV